MERHEQVYIDKAFPTLIQYFKVNEDVLGILTQREILSEGEAAILRETRTDLSKASQLLGLVKTRVDGYQALIYASESTRQSGAAKVLNGIENSKYWIFGALFKFFQCLLSKPLNKLQDVYGSAVFWALAQFICYRFFFNSESFLNATKSQGDDFQLDFCNSKLIMDGFFDKFGNVFNEALPGQHIAAEQIPIQLYSHLCTKDYSKPHILAFVGEKGSGTNSAVNLTLKSIKKLYNCADNNFHVFIGSDFRDIRKIETYKKELNEKINNEVNKCSRTVFVFHEVDDMIPGVIDILIQQVKDLANNNDSRRTLFILTGSIGAKTIDKIAFSRYRNKKRKDLTIKDFKIDFKLRNETYKRYDGWRNSALVQDLVINQFIPFISPERRHLLAYLRQLGAEQSHYVFTEDEYEDIVDDVPYQVVKCNKFYFDGFQQAEELFSKKLNDKIKSKSRA